MNTFTTLSSILETDAASQVTIPKPARSLARRALTAAIALVGIAVGAGVYKQIDRPATPSKAPESASTTRAVTVTSPSIASSDTELILPAQTLPNEQTTLYPRVDGYVAKWHADRGAWVTAGQLLAEIDAPELDQQVQQAIADGRGLVS